MNQTSAGSTRGAPLAKHGRRTAIGAVPSLDGIDGPPISAQHPHAHEGGGRGGAPQRRLWMSMGAA